MGVGRLPNLIVAGVPKAGTGSLFAYLRQHPDICPAGEKEVGYFNFYNPQRHSGEPPPLDHYRRHFTHCGSERYAFEATPTYSYGGLPVIEAMRRVLQRPRVIIALRDPVDRLWSAYTFQRELGNITQFRSFDEYLQACERRRPDGSDLVPGDHLHGLYIGAYGNYMPLWLEVFGEDLRVVFTEHLARDPNRVVAGLFEWLDIDPVVAYELDLAPRNTTQHPRSTRAARLAYALKRRVDRLRLLPPRVRTPMRRIYQLANGGDPPQKMDDAVRERLDNIYRASNERTAQALTAQGYHDLPDWLRKVTA